MVMTCLQPASHHPLLYRAACHPDWFMLCRAVSQLSHEGVMAAAAKCDVSKKHEVDQLVAWTVQTYGALDILIANAGIVKVCPAEP